MTFKYVVILNNSFNFQFVRVLSLKKCVYILIDKCIGVTMVSCNF